MTCKTVSQVIHERSMVSRCLLKLIDSLYVEARNEKHYEFLRKSAIVVCVTEITSCGMHFTLMNRTSISYNKRTTKEVDRINIYPEEGLSYYA